MSGSLEDITTGLIQPVDQRPSLTIQAGKAFVTIKADGTVIYGEGYSPDAAAIAFWDAVGLERKNRLP